MISIKYVLVILAAMAAYLLYRHIPSRRFAIFFCLALLTAAGLFCFSYQAKPAAPMTSPEERAEIQQQQQIFADWYTDYKKNIDQLDYNWQLYHHILADFKADNISIQTTYVRLTQLEGDAGQLRDFLEQLEPPSALNDINYGLTATVIQKTRSYTNEQYKTIHATKNAADPSKLLSNRQDEQSRRLEEIMIMESPAGLFTASEISSLKDNLTVPEES